MPAKARPRRTSSPECSRRAGPGAKPAGPKMVQPPPEIFWLPPKSRGAIPAMAPVVSARTDSRSAEGSAHRTSALRFGRTPGAASRGRSQPAGQGQKPAHVQPRVRQGSVAPAPVARTLRNRPRAQTRLCAEESLRRRTAGPGPACAAPSAGCGGARTRPRSGAAAPAFPLPRCRFRLSPPR